MRFLTRTLLATALITPILFMTGPDSAHYCDQITEIDRRLPMSHPVNICARRSGESNNWVSWATGNSRSAQFHFVDLFELLYRDKEIPLSTNTVSKHSHND